jgi:hypothetical protein|nr:phage tail assembly chaperone [Neorhizobium tomejilense]
MMFRLVNAPGGLGWPPAVFWSATLVEMQLGLEGQQGKFSSQPFVSREEVRRMAVAHGKRKSLKTDPRATNWSNRK